MDDLSSELSMLSRLMDATSIRTRVIAHNLANVNTPGFTRSKVVFEEEFSNALQRGDKAQARDVRPEVTLDKGGDVKPDGNNVHMEKEMAERVKTTILYNIVEKIISGRIKGLRTAIQGR